VIATAMRRGLAITGCLAALTTGFSVAATSRASAAEVISGYCEAIADPVEIGIGVVSGTGHSDCQGVGGVWFGDAITVVICIQKVTGRFPFYSYPLLACSEPETQPWPIIGGGIQTPILSGFHTYRIRTHVYGYYHHEHINIYAESRPRSYDPD
jgi:hypothetical protein